MICIKKLYETMSQKKRKFANDFFSIVDFCPQKTILVIRIAFFSITLVNNAGQIGSKFVITAFQINHLIHSLKFY